MGVTKLTVYWATGVVTFGALVCHLFPSYIIRMFTTDAELIAVAVYGLHIVFAVFPIVGFQMVASNFFLSIGLAKQAIFLSLTRQALMLIPCLIILPVYLGILGVWISLPVADFLSFVLTAVLLFKQFRRLKQEQILGGKA